MVRVITTEEEEEEEEDGGGEEERHGFKIILYSKKLRVRCVGGKLCKHDVHRLARLAPGCPKMQHHKGGAAAATTHPRRRRRRRL